ALAHVPQDELHPGIAVEHAAEDQAQRVGGGLDPPAPGGAGQFRVPAVGVRIDIRVERMQVQGHVEVLQALPEYVVGRVVVVHAVGVAVDQRALEAQLGDGALQFGGGGGRVVHGQRGKRA